MNKDYDYKGRLLKLANYLDEVPAERFSFVSWVGSDWKEGESLCSTTACALGHACSIPEFQALGLRLGISRFTDRGVVYLQQHGIDEGNDPAYEAALAVFDVDPEEFEFLFIPACDTYEYRLDTQMD